MQFRLWQSGENMAAASHVQDNEQMSISDSHHIPTRPYLLLTKGQTYFLVCLCMMNSICLLLALCIVVKLHKILFAYC